MPRLSPRRLLSSVAGSIVLLLACTACFGTPDGPATSTVMPPQYDAQPDFESVRAPAATTTSADATAAFRGSYENAGTPYSVAQVMNASQGGYSPMTNPRWFADHVAELSQMGIQRVRLDHVLDDVFYHAVSRAADGSLAFDFDRLDETVLPLVSNGIDPLIALTYSPTALAPTEQTPPPLTEWTEAVSALVTHYRDLGYRGWDWEVWNEPDGPFHWNGTFEQYTQLYAATAAAVKAIDPTARVGGAAASDIASDGNLSKYFVDFIAARRDVPVDFYSVHVYRTSGWDAVTTSRSYLEAAGMADLPILVTEWGNISRMNDGPGNGSDTNASSSGSSYVARRMYLASQTSAERVFYFSPIEGFTPVAPYNGDLGLITVDGHRKSVGNVFDMFSRLGNTRIDFDVSGSGTDTYDVYGFLSKTSTTSDSSLLLWNNTATDVAADVEVDDLPYAGKNMRVTQRVISSTQGNGFADTSTNVSAAYPSANENAPITVDVVTTGSRTYRDTIAIPSHGVVEIQLSATSEDQGVRASEIEPALVNRAAAVSGATATASSTQENADKGWGAAGLNDGRRYSIDTPTSKVRGWMSAPHAEAAATESIAVDLGASIALDSVVLWPYTVRGGKSAGFPTAATVRGSVDGTNWSVLAQVKSADGAAVSGAQTLSFPATHVRFISVEAVTLSQLPNSEQYGFALAEVEAYRTGVVNGGFEIGDLDGWTATGTATVQGGSYRDGSRAAKLTAQSSIATEIRGLRPNTTYTIGAYIRSASTGRPGTLTATLPVSGAFSVSTASDHWEHRWVSITTGATETSVHIDVASASETWVDDVTVSGPPQ